MRLNVPENGMIYDPVTIKLGSTVADALHMMEEYHIGGIPVVDNDRKLVGIVTNRDLRFERDHSRKVDEVMTSEGLVTTNQSTQPGRSSRNTAETQDREVACRGQRRSSDRSCHL